MKWFLVLCMALFCAVIGENVAAAAGASKPLPTDSV